MTCKNVVHFIDLDFSSTKKEELYKKIEITTQKIKDIRLYQRPNLTTGQFFNGIFLTKSFIVIICCIYPNIIIYRYTSANDKA